MTHTEIAKSYCPPDELLVLHESMTPKVVSEFSWL
jgi:hypothetical protein